MDYSQDVLGKRFIFVALSRLELMYNVRQSIAVSNESLNQNLQFTIQCHLSSRCEIPTRLYFGECRSMSNAHCRYKDLHRVLVRSDETAQSASRRPFHTSQCAHTKLAGLPCRRTNRRKKQEVLYAPIGVQFTSYRDYVQDGWVTVDQALIHLDTMCSEIKAAHERIGQRRVPFGYSCLAGVCISLRSRRLGCFLRHQDSLQLFDQGPRLQR